MRPCLATLPIDVLLEIYQYLSVLDISRLSRTCKVIRYSTKERSLWIKLYSDLWTLLSSSDPSSLSTQALIQRVVRDAVLDAQWRKSSTRASTPRKVYRSREWIQSAELLNDGQHLIIVDSENGALDIISTIPRCPIPVHSKTANCCPLTNQPLLYIGHDILPSSETEGYVFVDEKHVAEETQLGSSKFICARHVQVYQYNLSADLNTSKIVDTSHLILDDERVIYRWSACKSTFVCRYSYRDDEQCFLSCFEEKPTSPPRKLIDARFRLLKSPTSFNSNQDIVLASPRRVIVVGALCAVAIYDLPQQLSYSDSFGNRSATSISPIWKWYWPDYIPLVFFDLPRHSPIYRRASTPDIGMIHLVIGDVTHKIIFPLKGGPIVTKDVINYEKVTHQTKVGLRAFYDAGGQGYAKLLNSSIAEPWVSGSFQVRLEPGMINYVMRQSIDETSGHISFVVGQDGEYWVLIADIMELQ